jgi:RNA-directed DNA polymerase
LEEVHYETTVPTIRDRVVQTAAKLLLEPIFEADFDPNAYGYRPKRSAQGAVGKEKRRLEEHSAVIPG